jgi:murein DD-endopeptidase MepM/ murein hydrolase activator NlpD
VKALPAEGADSARYLANRLDAGSRPDPSQGTAASTTEGQRLARLAGEFESMLLVQMLREMRKSGSWEDEKGDKSGFGSETLFEMIDVELASYLTKAQGFGLEKSLVKQVAGNPAGGVNAVPLHLPSLDLPTIDNATTDVRSRGSLDPPDGAEGAASIAGPLDLLADRVQTSPFGWRRDPFSGATTYHRGVDLRAAYGEAIGAAEAGKVVFAGEQGGYGQTVVVEHADGVRTRYAHLSSLMTEVGAEVKAGEAIGRAGRSGRATGTHLHFEVTQNGRPIDPHSLSAGGLKVERVTADWGVGTGPTLPGVPSDARGSGAD